MTFQTTQEEARNILKEVIIIPEKPLVKILNKNCEKLVLRRYKINLVNSDWNEMTITYKVNSYTENVLDYSIYLTNSRKDILCICKYSPRIFNTLFNDIMSLEISNWQRIVRGLSPLRTINDFDSLMFELNIDNKQIALKLEKLCEKKNTSRKLFQEFKEFLNSNKVIPEQIWMNCCF